MPPRDEDRLRHILDAAERLVDLVDRHDMEDAADDDTVRYAIYWLLGVIGEASRNVSPHTRSMLALPWSKMVALRNRLAHGYFDINLEIAYRTAQDDVPTLIEPLRAFLGALPPQSGS